MAFYRIFILFVLLVQSYAATVTLTPSHLNVTCTDCNAIVTTFDDIYRNYDTTTMIHTIDTLLVPLKDFQHAHVTIDDEETKLYVRQPFKDTEDETCYNIDFDCFFFSNNVWSISSWVVLALVTGINIYVVSKVFILTSDHTIEML